MLSTLILLLLYLFSTSFAVKYFSRFWEAPPVPIDSSPPRAYAVVLTGGIMDEDFSENGHLQIGHNGDRLWQALHLYQKNKIKSILISGGDINLLRKEATSEAAAAVDFLTQNGVPSSAIFKEPHSRNTHENAVLTKQFLKDHEWDKNGYLITSAFHMKRAYACFQKEGIALEPFPSNHTFLDTGWNIYDFIPRAYFLSQNESFVRELVGYIFYKMKGFV